MFVSNLVSDSPTAEVLVATIRVCHIPRDCAKFGGFRAINLGGFKPFAAGIAPSANGLFWHDHPMSELLALPVHAKQEAE